MQQGPVDHFSIGLLGILTICSYGSWYYSFGVLLDPIQTDTDWSESTLAASFSAGTVMVGLAALFGGRMLDRAGHRPVFLLGATIGTAGLLVASWASHIGVFFVGAALGLAASGALGFYHVTMTVAVRLHPEESGRAIAVLTVWGALASAIFLPLTDQLESQFGWRPAVRVLALVTGVVFVLAAFLLPPSVAPADSPVRPSIREILASTVSTRSPRLFTIAVACGGLAMATMLVYQVPVMTTAGLSATAAASVAGFRGFCQLGGRLPLTVIVHRLGRDGALMLAFATMTVGALLLALSGSMAVAIAFAIVAGFGIGAFSPLQGMKSEELFERDQLGATMGAYAAVLLLAGSAGPILAGTIAEHTGDRRWAAVIAAVAAAGAFVATAALARTAPE